MKVSTVSWSGAWYANLWQYLHVLGATCRVAALLLYIAGGLGCFHKSHLEDLLHNTFSCLFMLGLGVSALRLASALVVLIWGYVYHLLGSVGQVLQHLQHVCNSYGDAALVIVTISLLIWLSMTEDEPLIMHIGLLHLLLAAAISIAQLPTVSLSPTAPAGPWYANTWHYLHVLGATCRVAAMLVTSANWLTCFEPCRLNGFLGAISRWLFMVGVGVSAVRLATALGVLAWGHVNHLTTMVLAAPCLSD